MKYSYSKLTSFYECPYAFYRNYNNREQGDGNLFAEYGILVHSILERYAKGKLNLFDLEEEFKSSFEMNINEPILMFGKDLTLSYYEKGISFFQGFSGFWELKPLEAEYRFETKIGKDFFVGVIDLIARNEAGELIIVDHKSSSKFSKKDLATKSRQLYLYSKAVYEKYGEFPKEIWFNHFKDVYLEKINFDKEAYEEAVQWALNTIEKIESCIDFEPNNSSKFYCNYLCDYRNNCDYKD